MSKITNDLYKSFTKHIINFGNKNELTIEDCMYLLSVTLVAQIMGRGLSKDEFLDSLSKMYDSKKSTNVLPVEGKPEVLN